MPFGKRKGKDVAEIESSYLAWIVETSDLLSRPLRLSILHELRRRIQDEIVTLEADELPPNECPRCHAVGFVEYDEAMHTSVCSACAHSWTPGRSAQ